MTPIDEILGIRIYVRWTSSDWLVLHWERNCRWDEGKHKESY